ncbi:MAG: hypothetical protein M1275_03705 [Patescibacteria group bacterium]|nr:hypothetical protein [Patescibacteria group bacterium]
MRGRFFISRRLARVRYSSCGSFFRTILLFELVEDFSTSLRFARRINNLLYLLYQNMGRKLIIALIVVVIVFCGAALVLRDRPILPNSLYYPLKLSGEWLDVNFLTFEAPAKQAKHLEYSERRLTEFLQLSIGNQSARFVGSSDRWYELELARSEFMAEQLALLDPRYISSIQSVYEQSLQQLEQIWNSSGDQSELARFAVSAQVYNSKAIKTLIQKHWNTDADRDNYQALVRQRLEAVRAVLKAPNPKQQVQLAEAEQILDQGREIEWAYDIISSVK